MIAEKLGEYKAAIRRREARFRAFTPVKGEHATRRMRLGDARVLLGQIHEFSLVHGLLRFHQNIGRPISAATIPRTNPLSSDLDQEMMRDAIRRHNAETTKARNAADALINALSDPNALAAFDQMLAVERLELMISVAEVLPVLDADDDPRSREEWQHYLSRMTSSGAFFDPVRISAVIDALPVNMTDTQIELDPSAPDAQAQIEAIGARYGYQVSGPDPAFAIEAALIQTVRSGHKFIGIFLGPAMMAIDNDNANTALGKALRALLPPTVIGQAATVDEIATRLTLPQVQSQFDLGSLSEVGARVGLFLNVLAIGAELRTLARQQSFDSEAFRSAATVVLQSADAAISAAQLMGYSVSQRGVRTTAVIVTLPLLILDVMAAAQSIGEAQRKADLSVAVGEALKLGGSVVITAASTYAAVTGTALLGGPVGWAIAVGFALVLVGEFLVSVTSNPPLVTFSRTCVFSNVSGAVLTSDNPDDLQFGFANGENFDVRRQSEKLAAIFHDPGFSVRLLNVGLEANYTHQVTVTNPNGSTRTVPTVPAGVNVQMRYIGKAGAITSPQTVPQFDRLHFQQQGVLVFPITGVQNNGWRGGFFEFLVDLSPALSIRAYAQVP